MTPKRVILHRAKDALASSSFSRRLLLAFALAMRENWRTWSAIARFSVKATDANVFYQVTPHVISRHLPA